MIVIQRNVTIVIRIGLITINIFKLMSRDTLWICAIN